MTTQQTQSALKGYEDREILQRTAAKQTRDGKEVFLATTQRSSTDSKGEFGPYVLAVVNNEEYRAYELMDAEDAFHLRNHFRQLLPKGRELSLDEVIKSLDKFYLD